MTTWKLPPRAKVFEALTALADGRVDLAGPGEARVRSSAGDKTYTVEWTDEGTSITSNDNASYWQGYAGYPILAVLMALGTLRVDARAAQQLAGVDWHDLNRRFRRDYDAAVSHVLSAAEARGVDARAIERQVDDVMEQLASLEVQRPARSRRPPKAG